MQPTTSAKAHALSTARYNDPEKFMPGKNIVKNMIFF